MNKNEQYIKKEILKFTTAPCGTCWSRDELPKMVENTFKLVEAGKDVDTAICLMLSTYDG